MITHTVKDANTGIKYSIFLTLDKHGLVITHFTYKGRAF